VLAAPDLTGAGSGRPAGTATGAGRARPDQPPSPAAAQVVTRRTTRFAAIWTVPRGGPRPGS